MLYGQEDETGCLALRSRTTKEAETTALRIQAIEREVKSKVHYCASCAFASFFCPSDPFAVGALVRIIYPPKFALPLCQTLGGACAPHHMDNAQGRLRHITPLPGAPAAAPASRPQARPACAML